MANVQGVVNEVKTQNTAYGVMYNVVVDGQQYGAGKNRPNVNPGDVVSFEAEQKGRYLNVSRAGMTVIGTGAVPAAPPQRSGSYMNKGKPFTGSKGSNDFGKNQEVISRQAARNSAIGLINAAIAAGALPLGAANAKVGDKFDALMGICDKLTEKYFNHSQGISQEDEQSQDDETPSPPDDEHWG